jgi:hypothetical protein
MLIKTIITAEAKPSNNKPKQYSLTLGFPLKINPGDK